MAKSIAILLLFLFCLSDAISGDQCLSDNGPISVDPELGKTLATFSQMSDCKLTERPNSTSFQAYCEKCVKERDLLITNQSISDDTRKRFDHEILKNQGRQWNQSFDRLVSDMAYIAAEGVINPTFTDEIRTDSCELNIVGNTIRTLSENGCTNGKSGEEVKTRLGSVFGFDDFSDGLKEFESKLKSKASSVIDYEVNPEMGDSKLDCLPRQLFYQYNAIYSRNRTKSLVAKLLELKQKYGTRIFDDVGENSDESPIDAIRWKILDRCPVGDKCSKDADKLFGIAHTLLFNNTPDVSKISYLLENKDRLRAFLIDIEMNSESNPEGDVSDWMANALKSKRVVQSLSEGVNDQCEKTLKDSLTEMACSKDIDVTENEYKDVLDSINGMPKTWRKVSRSFDDYVYDSLYCEKQTKLRKDHQYSPKLSGLLRTRAGYEQKVYSDNNLIYQDKRLSAFNEEMCPVLRKCSNGKCSIRNPRDVLSNRDEFDKLNSKQQKYIRELAEAEGLFPSKDSDFDNSIFADYSNGKKKRKKNFAKRFVDSDQKNSSVKKKIAEDKSDKSEKEKKVADEDKKEQEEDASYSSNSTIKNFITNNTVGHSAVASTEFKSSSVLTNNEKQSASSSSYKGNTLSNLKKNTESRQKRNAFTNKNVEAPSSVETDELKDKISALKRDIADLKSKKLGVVESSENASTGGNQMASSGSGISSSGGGSPQAVAAVGGGSSGGQAVSSSGPGMSLTKSGRGEGAPEIPLTKKDEEKQTLKNVDVTKIDDFGSASFLKDIKKWIKGKELLNDVFFLESPVKVDGGVIRIEMKLIRDMAGKEVIKVTPSSDNGNIAELEKLISLVESNKISASEKVELTEFVEKVVALL